MVERVEPLAHGDALVDLDLDLLGTERLEHHEGDGGVEGGGVQPAGEQTLAHHRSEVALLDVEHVSGSEEGAETVSALNGALGVVESVDNGLVELPVVVIHS